MKLKEFTYFLTVFETGEMGLELGDIHLYHCVHGNQLQVLSEFRVSQIYKQYYKDNMSVHTMDIQDESADIRKILEAFLLEFIVSPFVHNYPYFVKSNIFTIEEFDKIRETALGQIKKV